MIFGLMRFSCSLGNVRNSDHAMSSESKIVRASYAPRDHTRESRSTCPSAQHPTLPNKVLLKLLEEFQGQLVFWRQRLFANHGLHGRSIAPDSVFRVLGLRPSVSTSREAMCH